MHCPNSNSMMRITGLGQEQKQEHSPLTNFMDFSVEKIIVHELNQNIIPSQSSDTINYIRTDRFDILVRFHVMTR